MSRGSGEICLVRCRVDGSLLRGLQLIVIREREQRESELVERMDGRSQSG